MKRLLLLFLFALPWAAPLSAQNPDLILSPEERDSVLRTYDQLFPLLGKKAIARGFDMPYSFGANIIGLYMNQGIDFTGLALSTGDNPVQGVDFIQFGDNKTEAITTNARVDLWVLPFLNVYGLAGIASSKTDVHVTAPVDFVSHVENTGNYAGVGLTTAIGIKRNWLSFDINWAWTQVDRLDQPVRGRTMGIRYGRTFKIHRSNRMSVWAGTMHQSLRAETKGSIAVAEALPPAVRDSLVDYQTEQWYQDLGPIQKQIADTVMDEIINRYDTGTINYELNKSLTTPWNLLIGTNYEIGKRWAFRAEAGLIGRWTMMMNAVYRLPL
jgi:opacity protein-like surface antigen